MMKLNTVDGLFYKTVKFKSESDYSDIFLHHLNFAYSSGDALSKNYTTSSIDRMIEYGYVYNKDPYDLVFMVGIEDFGKNIFRSESRLFVHPKYRKPFWKSIDNYETVIYQINNHIERCDFIFKSREAKNGASFRIAQRLNSFFNDWIIHDTEIELKYRNNFQWICYKPLKENAEAHIKYLQFKV